MKQIIKFKWLPLTTHVIWRDGKKRFEGVIIERTPLKPHRGMGVTKQDEKCRVYSVLMENGKVTHLTDDCIVKAALLSLS